jgi:dTDP-4-dehydrorhamnose reductase
MKILVLGKNGMLGQTVYKYLKDKYIIDGTDRKTFDVLKDELENKYDLNKYDYVINCIGILNHETDRIKLITVNALFPNKLEQLAKEYDFKLIHISTDCYQDDTAYGKSKWLGELKDSLTLRTSIIGHDTNKKGTGLLNWFLTQQECSGYSQTYWSGITTLELAKTIEKCFKLSLKGIYNVTNGTPISKYDLLILIKDVYNLNIKVVPNDSIIANKVLNKDYEFNIPSYEVMIKEMYDENNGDIRN